MSAPRNPLHIRWGDGVLQFEARGDDGIWRRYELQPVCEIAAPRGGLLGVITPQEYIDLPEPEKN